MSRLLMCGWETGDEQQIGTLTYRYNDPYTEDSLYYVRSGQYSLATYVDDDPDFSGILIPHATQTELYYAFGLMRDTWEPTETPLLCFSALDSSGHVGIGLGVSQSGSLFIVRATAGGGRPLWAGPSQWTQLAFTGGALLMNKYALIEVHIVAATGATGTAEVKVNGTLLMSVTGVQTSQTNANLTAFRLELWRPAPTFGDDSSQFYFDDLRVNTTAGTVNNSWPGDGSIRALVPNGVGTTIGGTPLSPVGSSPNWQNVDERPPNYSDYNTGTAVGTGETYALTNPPAFGTCQAVNVIVTAYGPLSGGSIGITTKSLSGTSEGPTTSVGTTPLFYNRLLETNPDTSLPWTQAAVDALEAGITIR